MSGGPRIAVTGLTGQLVSALMERGRGRAEVVALGRPVLDLGEPGCVARALEGGGFDAIINAAAYTAVDRAESEAALALRINAEGAEAVALAAGRAGIPIVQLSTDYVFDGGGSRPYRETDATGPTGAYGRSKLEGERRVAAANPDHVIVRTAWVYSPFGNNFVRTMLALGERRDSVSVVADQTGNPTSALDLADALLDMTGRLVADPDPRLRGIFHVTGGGEASWADVAEATFAAAAACGRAPVAVRRITTAEYPTPARRPANSRLDGGKLASVYGIALPPWRGSLAACVARLLPGQAAARP